MPPVGIFAPDAGESIPQIPAIEEGIGHLKDDRPPMPMGWGEAFVIEALEAVEIVLDQAEKQRVLGISGSIDSAGTLVHALPNERACHSAIFL
jgi:hypothetical protein